ncbi:DUF6786 family protein [Draconibacterium sediminis]|uniref:Uncharacterized protein n=1 Tax=Draconibacterium sediminis TaxID=1544798 RepID=A0A0D8JDW0_9BACT|nr:DUF6786 family protein [Draconibacterium sediminis]KJF45107.1 hypothetical protein LH29_06770 [Draconibacterium sediminis]
MNKLLNGFEQGTYGYDVAFLKENNIETVELKDENTGAMVLLAPGYQGRVMTSSANKEKGNSYGWINYDLIQSGEVSEQFNPVGGEERFWLGPEGGPFSIYFEKGKEQVHSNWKVPAVIDTERFDIKDKSSAHVTFEKNTELINASGTHFNFSIRRTIELLSEDTLSTLFEADFPSDILDVVAYQSENTITNQGDKAWNKDGGLLSIWLLSMFNPSPTTTVFIPYETGAAGTVVNDEYFGKVPSDRLIVEPGTIYFKIDGRYRSKIGIPPGRAQNMCGSYDSEKNILTLVWGSLPKEKAEYVNSQWGDQDDPYDGDAVNAYNDGPLEDGSIMGPFYEIETSSPGAMLQPGQSLTHIQRVVHVQGDPIQMAGLVNDLFNLNLHSISQKFN